MLDPTSQHPARGSDREMPATSVRAGAGSKRVTSVLGLKSGDPFFALGSLCQGHKQTGNLRNNKELAVCLGQSSRAVKDSRLTEHIVPTSLARPLAAGFAATASVTPLATWQKCCFPAAEPPAIWGRGGGQRSPAQLTPKELHLQRANRV